jgi:hypothetical protein
MKQRLIALILLLSISVLAAGQIGTGQGNKRDAAKEDEAATAFAKARQDAGGTHLKRIRYKRELEELVCTAATTDNTYRGGRSYIYKTSEPGKVDDRMQKEAVFDLKGKAGYKRYSVAVWTAHRTGEQQEYWVAIAVYLGGADEFANDYLTDSAPLRNSWKYWVTPECRNR